MSTRSLIATPTCSDGCQGRYCHYDGYPSHMGQALWEIIHRDGPEQAIQMLLLTNSSWISVNSQQPDLTGVIGDIDAPFGTLEWEAANINTNKAKNIPGYGVALTNNSEWFNTDEDLDYIDYLYIIEAHQITIHNVNQETSTIVNLAGEEPNWLELEKNLHTAKEPA